MTGDVDLNGKIIGISGLDKKLQLLFQKSRAHTDDCDMFIHPQDNCPEVNNDKNYIENSGKIKSFCNIEEYLIFLDGVHL